jgi:phosphoserine phosphatase RsbU/P
MAMLRYFNEQDVLQSRTIGLEKFIIGRVDSCQIAIAGDLVSREHARLDREPDGRYRIRDLGSRNKTFVNGQQISETLLMHGDIVRIGDRIFEFLDDTYRPDAIDLSFLTPDRSDPPGTEWLDRKSPISMSLDRLSAIGVLGSDVGYPATADDVAAAVLGRLIIMLKAERGFVALRGESKKDLRIVAHRGFSRQAGAALTPASQTFVFSALLQSVAGRYPQRSKQVDAKAGFAAAALVAPIVQQGSVAGVIYADRPTGGQEFPASTLQEISAAGAHTGALMADASRRLADGSVASAAGWLATLRRTQLAMTVPPESGEAFDVSVKLMAGRMRCGDFCDLMYAGPDRVFLLLTDAGGHGMSGLIQANGVRTAVRTALSLSDDPSPALIMSTINRTLVARRSRQLVMCALVELNLSDGKITYVNAGCPPPLLLAGPGRLVTLDQPSLVLGIDTHYEYADTTADMPSSFRLVCHTDGLPELGNAAGEAFGAQRCHDLLLESDAFAKSPEVVARIVEAADRHRAERPCDDDALIVVIGHD